MLLRLLHSIAFIGPFLTPHAFLQVPSHLSHKFTATQAKYVITKCALVIRQCVWLNVGMVLRAFLSPRPCSGRWFQWE